jgi:hypothetical protein
MNKVANSKLEPRNSKQIQKLKNQKLPNQPVSISVFGFRIYFASVLSAEFILSLAEGLRTCLAQ